MTSQAKRLRDLLKKHNIADRDGKLRVRTERINRSHGYYEYGDAVTHVRELTKEEVEALVAEDKYLDIHVIKHPTTGFTVIRSGGSRVLYTDLEKIMKGESK